MRRIFTFFPYSPTVLFFIVLSLPLFGQQKLPHGVSSGWYSKAVAAIEDKEYDMKALAIPGAYAALNHGQHLGYWFTKSGYGVRGFNEDGSTKSVWEAQFLLEGVGRRGLLQFPAAATPSRTGAHRLDFDYGDYAVLYDNEKPGMEQSFLVKKRPAGEGALHIVLQIGGDLDAKVGADDALLLSARGNPEDTHLVYDQLKVWDNNRRQLAAHMRLNGRRLTLTVDDRGASYPLTVDPFSHGASAIYTVQGILNSGINDISVHTLYGYAVAGADLNQDGISDIIIGSPSFANIGSITISSTGGKITLNPTVTGATFVYYGISGSTPAADPSKVLQPSGLAAGSLFGFSISSAGNSNGSSSSVVVGAPGQQTAYTYTTGATQVAVGAIYIFNGGTKFNNNITTEPAADAILQLGIGDFTSTVTAPTRNPMFGWSVADAGDVNGDGYDDIIVGSPIYFETPPAYGGPASGRVDIFTGGASGVATTHTWTIFGSRVGELLGFSVNTAGNVNGDNTHSSVIMGAPGNLLSGSLVHGRAYVFYGGSTGPGSMSDAGATGSAGLTLTDPNTTLPGTLFGFSVSTAGDVDNDGKADLIVGAPLTPSGTFGGYAATGKVYVYYGGTLSGGVLTPSHPFATLTSPRASQLKNTLFGWSVANAGNVTGDNSGDVLVGEPGSLPVSSPTIGTLLTAVGINGTLLNNSGQAYVFAGNSGTGVSTSPILTVNDATSPTNELGYSVRTAGDVDGSGNTDFLIGEPGGSLDMSFNIAGLAGHVTGPTSTAGTLVNGNGLIVSASVGNALLYFGFTGTLPITLLDFTGQAQGTESLLKWSTAQEENSDYFSVERSRDGQNFTAIGQVSAASNSDQTTNYSFTDPSPVTGNNYYRLNMVNRDGTSAYSGVVVVNFNPSAQVVVVYPNPAHGSFQLLFRNMPAGSYGLTLLNAAGQTVMAKTMQASSPTSYSETVNLGLNLAAGTYLVRIVDSQRNAYITRIVIE
jgi:FG-GAP repeat/Secretion system C-terminal sorting domain